MATLPPRMPTRMFPCGAAGLPPLPPYDAEVEYLKSMGKQWIDMGVPFSDSTRIQVEYLTESNGTAIGVYEAVQLTRVTSNRTFARKYEIYQYPTLLNDGNWHTFDLSAELYVDGVLRHTYNPVSWTGLAPVFMFALRMLDGSAGDLWSGGFKYCRMYDGAVLVRDLIPVRFTNELGQSEGAMFDRANPTVGMNPDGSARTDGLYRNRGTGSFIIGPDKSTT